MIAERAITDHVHAYADPVRTDVYDVRVFETWGTWHKTVETWTYSCDCGDRVQTVREHPPSPPPVPARR